MLADRPGQLEGHSGPAQAGERIATSGQAGMDDRFSVGQFIRGAVVIGNDQLQAQSAGKLCFGDAGNPAIDGNDQRRVGVGDLLQSFLVEAIAFVQAIGDMIMDIGVQQAEAADEDGGGRDTVGIVVTVDHDPLPLGNGRGNPLGGLRHARQFVGWDQVGQPRIEEVRRLAGGDTSADQQLSDQCGEPGGALIGLNFPRIKRPDPPLLGHVILTTFSFRGAAYGGASGDCISAISAFLHPACGGWCSCNRPSRYRPGIPFRPFSCSCFFCSLPFSKTCPAAFLRAGRGLSGVVSCPQPQIVADHGAATLVGQPGPFRLIGQSVPVMAAT